MVGSPLTESSASESTVSQRVRASVNRLLNSAKPSTNEPSAIKSLADLQVGQHLSPVGSFLEPLVIIDLRALREEEQNSEMPITDDAFPRALETLNLLHLFLADTLPRTHLVPDGEGGIRIEWSRDDRNVRAVIPARADQRAYVYQRTGRDSKIEPLSTTALVEALRSVILAQ